MRYLSIDLESTGLEEDAYIIEFAAVPFDAKTLELNHSLGFHSYIQCPSFEQLKPRLSPWVIQHNKTLIETAHRQGLPLDKFAKRFKKYLEKNDLRRYLGEPPYTLFGKSLAALDLPLLRRDLGENFLRTHFVHRQLDLSSLVYAFVDMGLLDPALISGSELAKAMGIGEVAHTAMEDAVNTAEIYFKLLESFSPKKEYSPASSPQE